MLKNDSNKKVLCSKIISRINKNIFNFLVKGSKSAMCKRIVTLNSVNCPFKNLISSTVPLRT